MYLFFLMTIDFFSKRKKLRISSYPKKQRKAFLSESPQVLINSPNTPKKKRVQTQRTNQKRKQFQQLSFLCLPAPNELVCITSIFASFQRFICGDFSLLLPPQKKEKSVQQRNIINHQSKEWNTLRKSRFWFLPKKILKCWSFSPNTQKKKELRIKRKNGKKFFHLPFTDLILLIIFPFHWLSHPRKSKALRKENQFSSKQNLTLWGTQFCVR